MRSGLFATLLYRLGNDMGHQTRIYGKGYQYLF